MLSPPVPKFIVTFFHITTLTELFIMRLIILFLFLVGAFFVLEKLLGMHALVAAPPTISQGENSKLTKSMIESKQVQKIEVIRTELTRRGAGKSGDDPVRIIVQYWSLDGELLAERDLWKESQPTQ